MKKTNSEILVFVLTETFILKFKCIKMAMQEGFEPPTDGLEGT